MQYIYEKLKENRVPIFYVPNRRIITKDYSIILARGTYTIIKNCAIFRAEGTTILESTSHTKILKTFLKLLQGEHLLHGTDF